MAVQLGGKFDAADQLHARAARRRAGLVVPRKGVVVGDAQRVYAGANRLFVISCSGETGAVGFVSVRVQIDQDKTHPSVPV